MKPEDIEHLAALLKSRSGLILGKDKGYLVESRLAPIARRDGYPSVDALLTALRTRKDEALIWAVTDAMTTNETFFFRDKTPFDQFQEDILPSLSANRPGGELKIWCGACSTGQEPYSLSMILEEQRAKYPRLRLDILATDISERVLEKAKAGLYTQFEVQRGLPITTLVKYFEKADEMWRVKAPLKQPIRFRQFNLLDEPRTLGKFDVVFLRNVLIYFDVETKRKVLESIAGVLADDGYLLLGAAETVLGITEAFKPMATKRGLYAKNPEFVRRAA